MKGVFYYIDRPEVIYVQLDEDPQAVTTLAILSNDVDDNNANHLAVRPKDCTVLFTTEDIHQWVKEAYDEGVYLIQAWGYYVSSL